MLRLIVLSSLHFGRFSIATCLDLNRSLSPLLLYLSLSSLLFLFLLLLGFFFYVFLQFWDQTISLNHTFFHWVHVHCLEKWVHFRLSCLRYHFFKVVIINLDVSFKNFFFSQLDFELVGFYNLFHILFSCLVFTLCK